MCGVKNTEDKNTYTQKKLEKKYKTINEIWKVIIKMWKYFICDKTKSVFILGYTA